LEASGEVGFESRNREEVYGCVNQSLQQQRYPELTRSGRAGAAPRGEDNGAEPGAGDLADRAVGGR
jgi:hypothetical protein